MLKKQENLAIGISSLNKKALLKKLVYLSIFIIITLFLVLYYFGLIRFSCPFITFLGFKCMTCGATRSLSALLNDMNLISALTYNPLIFFWIFVFGLSYVDFFSFTCLQTKTNLFQRFALYIQKKKYLTLLLYVSFILNLLYLNDILL